MCCQYRGFMGVEWGVPDSNSGTSSFSYSKVEVFLRFHHALRDIDREP